MEVNIVKKCIVMFITICSIAWADVNDDFWTAAFNCDLLEVERIIKDGFNVDTPIFEYGVTALGRAAGDGYADTVEMLISVGADVNKQAEWGNTILMLVAGHGRTEIIRLLLFHNADINVQNYYGYTALIIAVNNGHIDSVELLITEGADVNAKDDEGRTPLIWAARSYRERITGLLINAGANINEQDDYGWTALMHASRSGFSKGVELLLSRHSNYNLVTSMEYTDISGILWEKGITAMDIAQEKSNTTNVQLLLEAGAVE